MITEPVSQQVREVVERNVKKIMKRLDQGYLHPKLEIPGLTCPGRESNPGL
jgi:hypothetical protein